MTDAPETRYARSGDVHVAYQVVGDGPVDLLYTSAFSVPVESCWELPDYARFLQRLASFSRLILFDRRGTGLSDPVTPGDPPTLEQWAEDALAVLDDVGSKRTALFGYGILGGPVCVLFAASHPERTQALVLANTSARSQWAPDYPIGAKPEELLKLQVRRSQDWGHPDREALIPMVAPSRRDDHEFREWLARAHRRGASPAMAVALSRIATEVDVRLALGAIAVPTLVLHRRGRQNAIPLAHGRHLAEHISGARFVELEGDDQLIFLGDTDVLLEEVQEFLTGSKPEPESDRVLATVLFTDIVASTQRAAELGDSRWRELLDDHDAFVRRQLGRHRGCKVSTIGLGDGILATFDGPARAIRCAQAIGDGVRSLGVQVRCGLHTGEVELRGDDIGGIAVHIAARVMDEAGAGEVLVSSTVKDLVVGAGITFEDRGRHDLRGVPGSWQLYAVIG